MRKSVVPEGEEGQKGREAFVVLNVTEPVNEERRTTISNNRAAVYFGKRLGGVSDERP